MADPDELIQKVLQKVNIFSLKLAIPNIPKRLKKDYELLREDADKLIFRKLWEKATTNEKIMIESDMTDEIVSPSRSRNRSRSSRSDLSDDYKSDDNSRSRSSRSRSHSESPSSSDNDSD